MNVEKKIKYKPVDIADNDYIIKIQVAIEFLKEIKRDIDIESKELDYKVSICDLKTMDILHYIEAYPKFNVVDGYKILKYLSNIRLERRVYKNQKKLIESIKNNKWEDTVTTKNHFFDWKYIKPNDIKNANNDIIEIEKSIDYLYKIKDDLMFEYRKIDSIMSRCDLKRSEILHYIEAYPKFNVVDGYKILKYLSNVLIEYSIHNNKKKIINIIMNNDTISKKTSTFKWDKVNPNDIFLKK